jgi:hypothetical protein
VVQISPHICTVLNMLKAKETENMLKNSDCTLLISDPNPSDHRPGTCCQFNKGLAPASYILFFVFILTFGSRDGQGVSIYGYMSIDVLTCDLTFFVPITRDSDN